MIRKILLSLFLFKVVLTFQEDYCEMSAEHSKKSLKEMIRAEISSHESEKYILSLVMGTNLESRVKSLSRDEFENIKSKTENRVNEILSQFKRNLENQIESLIPKNVKSEVKNYLNDNLEGKVNGLLLRLLPSLLPPLIKGEMLERLASLSGVDLLMREHKGQIEHLLSEYKNNLVEMLKQEAEFNSQQRMIQMGQIKNMTETSIQDFSVRIQSLTADIINQLVDTNGGTVLQNFVAKLQAHNNQHFIQLSSAIKTDVIALQTSQQIQALELIKLQSSLYWQGWLNVVIMIGVGGLVIMKIRDHY